MSTSAEKSTSAARHLLTSAQLSARHGYPTEWTLARWRRENIGPPYVRHIGRIYYDLEQVEAWELSQTTQPQEWTPPTAQGRKQGLDRQTSKSKKRDSQKRQPALLCMGDLFD